MFLDGGKLANYCSADIRPLSHRRDHAHCNQHFEHDRRDGKHLHRRQGGRARIAAWQSCPPAIRPVAAIAVRGLGGAAMM
jgi:hypothetical protein